jgi:hypothetical protein
VKKWRLAPGRHGEQTTPGFATLDRVLLTYREAQTQTYGDAFLMIGVCFVIAAAMVPLMRKVQPPAAPSPDAH